MHCCFPIENEATPICRVVRIRKFKARLPMVSKPRKCRYSVIHRHIQRGPICVSKSQKREFGSLTMEEQNLYLLQPFYLALPSTDI